MVTSDERVHSGAAEVPRTHPLLEPRLVARLSGMRLSTRRRVTGKYAGGHRSKRHGSSLEFADYREYVPGDDPRRVDLPAYRRLGKLLVKLTEAEDEAPVRVVVDQSASMRFGTKARRAHELAAALTVLGAGNQDPVRLLLAGKADDPVAVDPGPWMRGRQALAIASSRLANQHLVPIDGEEAGADDGAGAAGGADPAEALVRALHRAHGEGARGPVVLVSDLLFEDFPTVIRALAGPGARGGGATGSGSNGILVHLVGREDLDPDVRGDLRLVDSETGTEVEVAVDDRGLEAYLDARDAWLDAIDEQAGRHGIAVVRTTDDADLDTFLLTDLRAAGIVA